MQCKGTFTVALRQASFEAQAGQGEFAAATAATAASSDCPKGWRSSEALGL